MDTSDQRLLSTQVQAYALYDADDLLLLAPNTSNRWYPESKTRINAQYFFYLIAMLACIGGIIWPIIRYKSTPFFIDLVPIKWGLYFVYFAYWGLILHVVFYFVALIDLFLRYHPISTYFHQFKEMLYDATFAVSCLQMLVYCAFVFPERLKAIGEGSVDWKMWCLDWIQNANPLCLIVIETVIVHHRFGTSLCRIFVEVLFPVVIYGAYVGFSFLAHPHNKHWPYPIQNRTQNNQALALFYVCGALVLILGYVAAKIINRFMWKDQSLEPKENPEDILHSSFTTASVFSSFRLDQDRQKHYVQPQRQQHQYGAESLVVGSPQSAYNGYGTVGTVDNNNKGYY